MRQADELRSIDRFGRATLLVVFGVLLGGRYTLDRLGGFPAVDLRWVGLVVIGCLCLVWVTMAHERTVPVRLGAMAGWFGGWVAWMGLSASWAPTGARPIALVDLAFLAAIVAAGWGVAARIHPRALSSFWWWPYAAAWAYLLGAFAAGPDEQGRYSAFGGGPNVFVRVMALGVLAALLLALARQRHWVLLGVPPFLLGTYLSGSRGGLLALGLVAVIGTIPLLRRMSRKTRGALVLGALAVALLAPLLYDPRWLAFGQRRFVEQTLQQGYDADRGVLVEQVLRIFGDHLWLGAGLDGFYALNGQGYEYPHNLLLATAAEGGIPGLVLVIVALGAGAFAVARARPLSPDGLGFALAAGFMFVASMFSGDYYDSRLLWFFLGCAVIAGKQAQKAPAGTGRRPESSSSPAEAPRSDRGGRAAGRGSLAH